MISPPTQQPSDQENPNTTKPREVKLTPARKRAGQTRTARFVKAIFRPFFKGIYYTLKFVRGHKLLSLGIIILLLASIAATDYFATGQLPYGVGSDPFDFHVRGTNGGGDIVKNWLYALRNGDASTLQLLDANISQPPDPNQLVSQFGQTKSRTWKAINVISAYSESDTTIDSFVEVDFSANGPGGSTTGIVLFHFVTISQGGSEALLNAQPIDFRKPLQ
jgi:hypothetical protein